MTLKELTQKKLEEFDLGCNEYNISDPPADKQWIKSFLSQAIQESAEEAIGAVRVDAKEIVVHVVGNPDTGYNQAVAESKKKAKEYLGQ